MGMAVGVVVGVAVGVTCGSHWSLGIWIGRGRVKKARVCVKIL